MLRNLHVKNLALIDESEVCFGEGLNILSGETGAGKSIIIGSINLALGEKVPKELLRENGEDALVELIFDVDKKTEEELGNMDIFPEDGILIMSRKISKGHATAKINSETVTVSKMKEVSELLIDIHGQHEHQSLLQKRKHLEILDNYAKEAVEQKKALLAEEYEHYRTLLAEFKEADMDDEKRMRELSFLEFEINEITEAAIKPGEDEELEEEYKRLSHGRKIMEALEQVSAMTSDQSENASELISRACRELATVKEYGKDMEELYMQLSELDDLLNDFNHDLSRILSDTDFDEKNFYDIEKRMDEINHLKAKYGNTVDEINKRLEEKQAKADRLREYDVYLSGLKSKTRDSEDKLKKMSSELSALRKKYAKNLEEKVVSALIDLNFLDVRFEMQFDTMDHFTASGTDDAQFMISVNPGEPLRPLNKIASGGELSRIMLALKTVLADNDGIGTLIFDEIDAGISGRTAQAVSEKLHTIAGSHQIICITHLPQIAAMADTHFLIQKSVIDDSTVSEIRELSEDDSVAELARMIGGVKITDTVLNSAREMKELAKSAK